MSLQKSATSTLTSEGALEIPKDADDVGKFNLIHPAIDDAVSQSIGITPMPSGCANCLKKA
jgi:hypothetical protein